MLPPGPGVVPGAAEEGVVLPRMLPVEVGNPLPAAGDVVVARTVDVGPAGDGDEDDRLPDELAAAEVEAPAGADVVGFGDVLPVRGDVVAGAELPAVEPPLADGPLDAPTLGTAGAVEVDVRVVLGAEPVVVGVAALGVVGAAFGVVGAAAVGVGVAAG